MTIENDGGGANPSYQGYDYQKLVTVWVALRLMFSRGAVTDQVVVEPASHDDIKALLAVSQETADSSLKIIASGELHVQIKFKGAGAWSSKEFAGVVNDKIAKGIKGPKPRPRAKAMLLADGNRRYVFITNSSVDGVLAKGRVKYPEQIPDADFTPSNLNLKAPQRQSLAGRFALIEGMTHSETRRQIDEILTERLHVPSQGLDACVDRLKRAVEDRFLAVPDPLRKADIEKVAEGFGGVPHANPQLARYVAPANLPVAEARLTRFGAVLLIGPSGYGKSLTADKLAFDRRHAAPPYKVVRESAGLPAIEEAFAAPGRVLFHLEDPWGQSALKRREAEEWSKRISALIHQRVSDKQFVITSRSEIYRAALSASPPPVWADRAVVIDDDAYDDAARQAILHGSLAVAGAWRQDLALQHEARLLRTLRSPFELNAFARELIAVQKPAEADINRLVDRALSDSRQQVVRDQIRGFGDRGVRGAVVLWALLRYSRSLPPSELVRLRREVDREDSVEIGLDDLAEHLAQTQLTKDGDGAYVAHAKVIEAMEQLAREQPRAAEDALNATARAALILAAQDLNWLNVVERLVTGARALENDGVELDEAVETNFDRFLSDGLTKAVGHANAFRRAWRAADRRLSPKSPIGWLVNWLEHGAPKEKDGFAAIGWRPPKVSKADREAVIAADPRLHILKGFIAHQLPRTATNYDGDDLLPWLKSFGEDFTEAFLAAGQAVAEAADYVMSADAISECALAGLEPPYEAVWDQIEKMQASVDAALTQSSVDRHRAWQGELDFAESLHIQERVEEEGPSANHFAKGYVKARRSQQGHGWIVEHPRPDIILPLWAEAMRYNWPKVTAAELDAFFEAAEEDDRLQAAGLGVIADRRLEFGRDRVSHALTSGGPKAIDAAVRALSFLEGDGEEKSGKPSAQTILLELLSTLSPVRAALLAPEIANLEFGKKKVALAQRILAASPPDGAAAVHLALSRTLGADDITLLQCFRDLPPRQAQDLLVEGPRSLTRLLLLISAAEGQDVLSLAKQWAESEDEDDAQAAVRALAELGCPEARSAIVTALSHPHYKVRRIAATALAPKANEAEKVELLKLTTDKSAPVRAALAVIIGQHGWSEGVDALLTLLDDRRNYARHPEHQHREEPEYHVARAAAEALGRFGTLPAAVLDHIIAFLNRAKDEAIDVVLHADLLDLLTYPDHPSAWDAIEHGLHDYHVVGGKEENLYPVRYAAGWAVVHRISRHPLEHDLVPWTVINAASDHIDPQFAAPLLLALGTHLATDCDAGTLEALRSANTSDARVAVALSMIDDHEAARALAIRHGLLATDHPFLDDSDDVSTNDAQFARWPLSSRGRTWLSSLQDGDDVESTLLWMMAGRTGLPLINDEFHPWQLQRKEAMPIMTFAEMFGME
ncbi:HEAT repeat domain-containing protein [Paraburkholderia phenazinium]|uniref:PBS lyase HEAT-like repeat-containing protein n=1 Tax=Paraburkholderia phenazinium TaxID=60549 RepID=A0A1N6KU08_9BURK|nr:HEAT repeat domain-containing protein [Paraburkholderia phenazinium]SIO59837.1 PBS lyase HEAT-like repeat-containing protein [Paraburkholderia phenazinium]